MRPYFYGAACELILVVSTNMLISLSLVGAAQSIVIDTDRKSVAYVDKNVRFVTVSERQPNLLVG